MFWQAVYIIFLASYCVGDKLLRSWLPLTVQLLLTRRMNLGNSKRRKYSHCNTGRITDRKINWARPCEALLNVNWDQQRRRSACASAQSDQHIFVCCHDSRIPYHVKTSINRLKPGFQCCSLFLGVNLTWSEILKTPFRMVWLNSCFFTDPVRFSDLCRLWFLKWFEGRYLKFSILQ